MVEQTARGKTRDGGGRGPGERGFSMLQLIITIAIISVVSAFAFMGIRSARESMRLSGSARQFANYVEKARIDAIRRHATTATASKVQFLNTTTYRVTMDFDGQGTISSRDISLESGVAVSGVLPGELAFDWRGRASACLTTFPLANTSDALTIDVTGSGDVTIDSDVASPPEIVYSNVNTTSDIASDSTVKGTTVPTVAPVTDCSDPPVGSSGTTTNTGTLGCAVSVSPTSLTIRKAGGTVSPVTVTMVNGTAGTLTVTGPSNLKFTPASQPLGAIGSTTFTIQSINSTRGTFQVNVTTSCYVTPLIVKVVK
ncbi:MAG TPA: hypothetical protein VF723_09015 [Pyrinomonadaceae bacterium]|jgi:type II secretory pathway pseudopilin PulG